MKKLTFVLLAASICFFSKAQTWTQKANFPGNARFYDAGFVIGQYGFIGCGNDGSNFYNDFYKWNQVTNTWSPIANYPGNGYYYSPVAFSIEGKGYVGLGKGPSGVSQDLWRYDTTSNAWTAMASLPGTARYDEAVFVIGHKAYIITGSAGGPPYLNDVWVYDARANSWTQLNNSPAGHVDGMVAFAIGSHGYIGGGWDGSNTQSAFWEYDTTNDTWDTITRSPVPISGDTRSFVIGSTAYVCTGTYAPLTDLQAGYAYDTNTHAWTTFTNMGANGIERSYAVAFTIGNYGYIGTGLDSTGGFLNTFWQFAPQTSVVSCNPWTQEANFTGNVRDYDAGFVIGHYGFIGNGCTGPSGTYFSDFFKWNQTANSWSAISSYPGAGTRSNVSGSIEGKGYVGLGVNSSQQIKTDWWEYDTANNTWTAKASFPGTARYDATSFVIGHKLYVIGGSPGGPPYLSDAWVYDAHANTWTQLNNSPAPHIDALDAFVIGNHAYIGGGWDGSNTHSKFWEYDTTNDTWDTISKSPVPIAGNSRSFVLGSTAYLCTGTYAPLTDLQDGYAYDTNTHAWTTFTNMGANGIERSYAVAFTIGNYGYIGTGLDSTGTYNNSFWQYYPCSDTVPLTNAPSITIQEEGIKIYPNPSNGVFHVSFVNLQNTQSTLMIMDMMGRSVKSIELQGHNGCADINVYNFNNGVYFYRVLETNNITLNGKLIINK